MRLCRGVGQAPTPAVLISLPCPACRRNGGAGWMPLVLYDTGSSVGLAPPRSCYWSDFYQRQGRDPANVSPAPWVSG